MSLLIIGHVCVCCWQIAKQGLTPGMAILAFKNLQITGPVMIREIITLVASPSKATGACILSGHILQKQKADTAGLLVVLYTGEGRGG